MGGEMFCLLSTICEHNPSHPQIGAVPAWLALNRAVPALIAFLTLSARCGCPPPTPTCFSCLFGGSIWCCVHLSAEHWSRTDRSGDRWWESAPGMVTAHLGFFVSYCFVGFCPYVILSLGCHESWPIEVELNSARLPFIKIWPDTFSLTLFGRSEVT